MKLKECFDKRLMTKEGLIEVAETKLDEAEEIMRRVDKILADAKC